MEKQAKFAFNNHIGYVTTCPTNLGTGLRASIHVKLPKLSSNWKKFEAIAAKHHV
jgi:protein-arginine kinase